jgi:predicted transcriptional regulator of viral defense system
MVDAFACAQAVFNGYISFSSALYLQKMIAEMPFSITVATSGPSDSRVCGQYEFRAVSLKEQAIGFRRMGNYDVSSRAKTLFDCLYLPRYSPGFEKLVEAYHSNPLSKEEWSEFGAYVQKFTTGHLRERMIVAQKKIRRGLHVQS